MLENRSHFSEVNSNLLTVFFFLKLPIYLAFFAYPLKFILALVAATTMINIFKHIFSHSELKKTGSEERDSTKHSSRQKCIIIILSFLNRWNVGITVFKIDHFIEFLDNILAKDLKRNSLMLELVLWICITLIRLHHFKMFDSTLSNF